MRPGPRAAVATVVVGSLALGGGDRSGPPTSDPTSTGVAGTPVLDGERDDWAVSTQTFHGEVVRARNRTEAQARGTGAVAAADPEVVRGRVRAAAYSSSPASVPGERSAASSDCFTASPHR